MMSMEILWTHTMEVLVNGKVVASIGITLWDIKIVLSNMVLSRHRNVLESMSHMELVVSELIMLLESTQALISINGS